MLIVFRGSLAAVLVALLVGCPAADQASNSDVRPPEPEQPSATVADDPFRLASTVRPLAQQLRLRIDPARPDYSGTTTIDIEIGKPTRVIRLHAEDMQIDSVTVSKGPDTIGVASRSGEQGLLVLEAGQELAPGRYVLTIEFSNDFNTDGVGIHRNELEGRHYIFSQFQAVDAREAFPCFDEPGFKIPWQLTITTPEDQLPITNTPEEAVTVADGWKTAEFAATPPLPSYLIAVAVGPFETVPIEGMSVPGRIIVPQGRSALTKFAVETTPPLLAYLEEYFGEPYPFRKLDLIATVGALSGAMEHPGAITYSEFILLLDENASARQRDMLLRVTAHELAHQWFGNLVTMRWWNDLWLNESFADWMAGKTVAAVYPDSGSAVAELRTLFQIMDTDTSPAIEPIRRDFKSTDSFVDGVFLSYYKGKTVLNMFEQAVGEDVFRDGVIRYLAKFHRGNATAADLWEAIDVGADFDLAGGLQSFVDQPGIPLISVAPLGEGRYEFAQSRLVSGGDTDVEQATWILPVAYKYPARDGVRTGTLILDADSRIVDLDETVPWILPNADQKGYYRWSIPAEMQEQLGRAAGSNLGVRERMGMLSNLWALLVAGTIDGADYLSALASVAADPEPAVVSALIDQLGSVEETFVTADLRDEFADFVTQVLTPSFAQLGAMPRSDEESTAAALRPRAFFWLAVHGDDEAARAAAAELAKRYLDGAVPFSEEVSSALRVIAADGDPALYDMLRERFEASTLPRLRVAYVTALGSFHDPEIVARALDYALDGPLRRNDLTTLLVSLNSWTDSRDLVLDWLIANDARLRERLPGESISRIPLGIVGCSLERLERVKDFYGAPERAVPGMGNALEDAEASAVACQSLRRRELDSVREYLL